MQLPHTLSKLIAAAVCAWKKSSLIKIDLALLKTDGFAKLIAAAEAFLA